MEFYEQNDEKISKAKKAALWNGLLLVGIRKMGKISKCLSIFASTMMMNPLTCIKINGFLMRKNGLFKYQRASNLVELSDRIRSFLIEQTGGLYHKSIYI
ncbi:hypothetical protein A8F94_14870 [Bacillus sp. FJAT-27225]|uniref:hypothetical protein n=1 Tax=Bacillus sp. FJAT-27225 TaxID=1743144 RepID=UPI00080C3071|nr:hypothetical protein [Bacillus sp. FJAT-27225]OCA84016.1 hypothetical protein A8F94_14870 [Bacillus sp. FJAT-27225]